MCAPPATCTCKHGISHALVARPELRPRGSARSRTSIMELLEIFGLAGERDCPCKRLPYGDQRRLEIVRALATRPKLLLLDEPAAGMNPTEKVELMKLIRFTQEKFGLAVLLVEHDMKVVMGICERITVLDYGQKIAEGTPAEIRAQSEGHRRVPGEGGGRCLRSRTSRSATARSAALHGICAKVEKGSIVTLVGANGAGKTTTLRAISGLVKARSRDDHLRRRGHHEPAAAQDRRARHRPISRRTHGLRQSHRHGKSPDGRLPAERQGGHRQGPRITSSASFPRLKERESRPPAR